MNEETTTENIPMIAIIGMAGRFPGAPDPGAFWHNLANGVESIATFKARPSSSPVNNLVGAGGVLPDIDLFDARFFGFTPREAEVTDPQQRLFLECAWEALESAAQAVDSIDDQVGVFAGCDLSTYLFENLTPHGDELLSLLGPMVLMGNDKDYLCTRVSYKLGLKGPSISVATACSTSLVAVQLACQSLLSYQCDIALAGGAGIAIPQDGGYQYREGMINSASGRVRAFDADADGAVRGNGVGVVALKRLEEALEAGDPIHAVIRGAAVNNDGSLKAGFTTPSSEGQAAVILEALLLADVPPQTIGMIEAHGTGTVIGDPIEVAALIQAFDTQSPSPWCALGSAKTNLGHLNTAAGIAGLIKTVLALKQRQIPPSLNFQTPNPGINFENSPFYVNTTLKNWPALEDENGNLLPRRAGVSSFGIGGTNAHIILEEAPQQTAPTHAHHHLLVLSAKSPEALPQQIQNLILFLKKRPHLNPADVAVTLQKGRNSFPHRTAATIRATADLNNAAQFLTPRSAEDCDLVLVFPDIIAHDSDQIAQLYHGEPIFQSALDTSAGILNQHSHEAFSPLQWALETPSSPTTHFVVSHALAQLWLAHDLRPFALIGKGLGHIIATVTAGALRLEDALIGINHLTQRVAAGGHGDHSGTGILDSPQAFDFQPPNLPLISGFTGEWFNPGTENHASDHTETGFDRGIRHIYQDTQPIFLELGYGALATHLQELSNRGAPKVEAALTQDEDAVLAFHQTLGRLWCSGVFVDWSGRYSDERRLKLRLPTHPFQRSRFWIDPPKKTDSIQLTPTAPAVSRVETLDQVQQTVTQIFAEILARSNLSATDDFFELGGDSLTATMLLSRLDETLGAAPTMDQIFDNPTIGGLSAVLDAQLASNNPALSPAMIRRQPNDPAPLSFSQRRLWFLHQLKGGDPAYNLPFALRLEGDLDMDTLTWSLSEIVRRHQILRTTFHSVDGEPYQVIHPAENLSIPLHDWSMKTNHEPHFAEFWREWAGFRFDLEQGPLLLACLIRLSQNNHVFLLNLHHIITDGWSNGVLVNELSQLYRAGLNNQPSPLPEIPIQFADFALWQQRNTKKQYEALAAWWRHNLAGMPQFTAIPGDRPRPEHQTFTGATLDFNLDSDLAGDLKSLALSQGVSLYMCLDACFAVLYARHSGQLDFGLGAPLSNRGNTQIEGAVGFFADTLVIRHNLTGPQTDGPPFSDILQRVRRTVLDAFAHQDLPFEQVVDAVQPQRSQSWSPLFQTMFVLQNAPHHRLDLPNLKVLPVESPLVSAKFDLTLFLWETDEGLSGSWEYNTDLYDLTTIQGLTDDFQSLARNLAGDPQQPVYPLCRLNHTRPTAADDGAVDTPFVAPRNPLETTLADIWTQALDRECVGIHDDFFEIGGHSLLAVRVKVRLEKALGKTLPLNALFEHRTIAALAQAMASGAAKHTSLEETHITIDPDARYQPFPLTDVQFAYWMGRGEHMTGGNVAAHLYMEAEGDINPDTFKSAWRRLAARHDMLRCVILPDGRQQILKNYPVPVTLIDLSNQDSLAQTNILKTAREEMSHQILPPDRPLYQIRVYRLSPTQTRIHFSIDALIVDAMSTLILGFELDALYRDPHLNPPPPQLGFRDYVITAQNHRQTAAWKRAKAYWTQRLDSLPPGPDLPLARRLESISNPRFQSRRGDLPKLDWDRLKQRAAKAGLTPSALILTAFAQILGHWSTTPRFTLNLTTFNRRQIHPDVDQLVGDFTALTLLAVDSDPRRNFLERANQLQKQLITDLDHGEVNGVEVLRDLRHHSGSRETLMPVVFTSTLGLPDAGKGESRRDIMDITHSATQTPQVWLDHNVREAEGCLILNWDGVEALFPEGMLDDMFDAYMGLLQKLSAADTTLDNPTLATQLPRRQAQQREAVNATHAPLSHKRLHELVEITAVQNPNAPAVFSPDRNLSRGQLQSLSRRWAALLIQHGVEPGDLVPVVMDKGWQQVVAVLAVLQSGAAYLPIDPALPVERRNYLLSRDGVKLALTQPHLREHLSVPSLAMDHNDPVVQPLEQTPRQAVTDTAYVIFTSGSTGLPKGVVIDHRGAVNTIRDINSRFQISSHDRVLCLSNLNFDLSVYDVFGVLAAGGALVIPEADNTRDPAHWAQLCRDFNITLWNTVPALMRAYTDYLSDNPWGWKHFPRQALLSGDWIPMDLPKTIAQHAPDCRLISLGGATEASIWSNFHIIQDIPTDWKSIPYGRPLTNQSLHILDSALLPRPVWTPGHLYIGGQGLAKGYLGDETKTNAAFIRNPHTDERLYRTGDLGRYLPNGEIEFLGRADNQIKIRGHRIEPGEIEATLSRHPDVSQALVLARGPSRENRRLIAYVTTRESAGALSPQKSAFILARHGLRPVDVKAEIIPLPELENNTEITRRSQRTFPQHPVPWTDFSAMLSRLASVSSPESPLPKFAYPSAGSLYPVQVYLHVRPNAVHNLKAGLYYHDPALNQLRFLDPNTQLNPQMFAAFNRPILETAGFALFLVGKLDAVTPIYGNNSRDFCLLEAGYIGQLLMEQAVQNHIGLCPIGALDFESLQQALALDENHIFLHGFLGGAARIDPQTISAAPQRSAAKSLEDRLIQHLSQQLPAHMIPGAFVFLEQLPTTANGKINLKALPEPTAQSHIIQAPRTPTEVTLAEMWAAVLDQEPVGVNQNFFDLGGDSLILIQLITRMKGQFKRVPNLTAFFKAPTITATARYIDGDQISADSVDFTRETRLEPLPTLAPYNPKTPVTRIFLTGATGFVGSFLLQQLLAQTKADVYCLVRADDADHAWRRLNQTLGERLIEVDRARLITVPGDLSQPLLGLGDERFAELARSMDVVYHCGTRVNFAYPYHMLKAANVNGLRDIIGLAAQTKTKPLHHISSLAFLPPHPACGPRLETDAIGDEPATDNGYLQTKWVADHLAQSAAAMGLPVSIYRFGLVSGHSTTGVSNTDDAFAQMIHTFAKEGVAPDQAEIQNMVPIDYLSKAIVTLSKRANSGGVYHLYNPQPPDSAALTDLLCNQFGLQRGPANGQNLPAIEDMYDQANTRAGLAGTDLVCPAINAEVLKTYLNYFKTKGFFNQKP